MVYNVFISHSNHEDDWQRIESLEQWLGDLGIEPILARRAFSPEPVSSKVHRMIDSSDAVIVFWTAKSSQSGFVNQEIGYAFDRKPIIILQDQGTSMTGFVYGYNMIHMGTDRAAEEVEKLKDFLLERKTTKELTDLIVGGLVGFAVGLGLVLLFSGKGI